MSDSTGPGASAGGAGANAGNSKKIEDAVPPVGRPGPAKAPPWGSGGKPPQPFWTEIVKPDPPQPVRAATLWSVVATGLLAALLLGDGLGMNLLIIALPAALAAYFAGQAAGRRPRPLALLWGAGGLALLIVPALRDAGWPVFLALVAALGAGAWALNGARGWRGMLFGPLDLLGAAPSSIGWAVKWVRGRAAGSKERWMPLLRTSLIAAVLLAIFGALFATADAAFADLLGSLTPDMSAGDGPLRLLLFLGGGLLALSAAHTAAAPLRRDRLVSKPGRARGRMEWALPLIVLNVLFAAFIGVQLVVLFGGYDAVLSETGLTYAEYARQGFWQLLLVTLLVLVVLGIAARLRPRSGRADEVLVRLVLGTLCSLTVVVVASALRRMELYVDAYGLTRLRLSVAVMEIWLGLVILLIMAAGVWGVRWLPRAVMGSAAAAVLAFGLVNPDALIAEQNVARFERTGKIDTSYLSELSADAVPALDALPEPERACALRHIAGELDGEVPWYATSLSEIRAREILDEQPAGECSQSGLREAG